MVPSASIILGSFIGLVFAIVAAAPAAAAAGDQCLHTS